MVIVSRAQVPGDLHSSVQIVQFLTSATQTVEGVILLTLLHRLSMNYSDRVMQVFWDLGSSEFKVSTIEDQTLPISAHKKEISWRMMTSHSCVSGNMY